jgi:hypothetical protein
MRSQLHRWLLLSSAILFLGVGSATVSQGFSDLPLLFSTLVLGIFYLCVGNICIWQHVSSIAGDWDDEESYRSS